jgi:large subunit ribosomal protein L22
MDGTEITARGRFLRFSPFKARVVADQVKGKAVSEALQFLRFSQFKNCAPMIRKIMQSAVANAEARTGVNVDTLYVKGIVIDGGPTLKRMRFRARGRADRRLHRTSHVTVILDQR